MLGARAMMRCFKSPTGALVGYWRCIHILTLLLGLLHLVAAARQLLQDAATVTDEPFGQIEFKPLGSCRALLDVVRPERGVDYYYGGNFYREGSRWGNVYTPIFLPLYARNGLPMPMAEAAAASDSAASSDSATAEPDFSQTNVQVAGVDEADIVKSDGKFIYAAGGRTLLIYQAAATVDAVTDQLELARVDLQALLPKEKAGSDDGAATTGPGGAEAVSSRFAYPIYQPPATLYETFRAADLLLEGDTLLIIGEGRAQQKLRYPIAGGSRYRQFPTTVVLAMDVSSRSRPTLLRVTEVEGSYVTGREAEGAAYLVLGSGLHLDVPEKVTLAKLVRPSSRQERQLASKHRVMPRYREGASGPYKALAGCGSVGYVPGLFYQSIMTVAAFSMADGSLTGSTSVLGPWSAGSPAVVAYPSSLYVGLQWQESYPWYSRFDTFAPLIVPLEIRQGTVILAFDLSKGAVAYRALGQAPGVLLNQFSMDEFEGTLRAAVTVDRNFQPVGSSVYAFDSQTMSQVGKVTGLAPGERIYSVRFLGPRGYVVTFRQVDPLFVLDLAEPAAPKVVGELKIPGFSDYLHPVGASKLLGFGSAATELGRTTGLKVALFDVSDPASPKEQQSLELGGPGSSTEIVVDHKALLFKLDAASGRAWFVLPVQLTGTQDTCLYDDATKAFFAGKERTPAFLGAYVVTINLNGGKSDTFEIVYELEHGPNGADPCYAYCSAGTVKRSLYVGDVLYTMADRSIKAYQLSKVLDGSQPKELADLTFFTTLETPAYLGDS